jgi:hypothetical protein
MENADLKPIIIEYRGIQNLLNIDPSVRFEQFITDVKASHEISNETNIVLFDRDTNSFIIPTRTSQLWSIQARSIPIYHANKPGKYKEFFKINNTRYSMQGRI